MENLGPRLRGDDELLSLSYVNLNRNSFHREGREGKQNTNLVIKITNLAIESGFNSALISLASLPPLAVQMLD